MLEQKCKQGVGEEEILAGVMHLLWTALFKVEESSVRVPEEGPLNTRFTLPQHRYLPK